MGPQRGPILQIPSGERLAAANAAAAVAPPNRSVGGNRAGRRARGDRRAALDRGAGTEAQELHEDLEEAEVRSSRDRVRVGGGDRSRRTERHHRENHQHRCTLHHLAHRPTSPFGFSARLSFRRTRATLTATTMPNS